MTNVTATTLQDFKLYNALTETLALPDDGKSTEKLKGYLVESASELSRVRMNFGRFNDPQRRGKFDAERRLIDTLGSPLYHSRSDVKLAIQSYGTDILHQPLNSGGNTHEFLSQTALALGLSAGVDGDIPSKAHTITPMTIERNLTDGVGSNGRYEGQSRNRRPFGQGVMTYNNGSKYEGLWRDGIWHGQGASTHSCGVKYEGVRNNGKSPVNGVVTYTSGGKYTGDLSGSKPHGQGVMTYSNNDWQGRKEYDGAWQNGQIEGHGRLEYRNGNVYEGEFVDDKIQGKGVMTYQNGDIYKGAFEKEKAQGKGVMTYQNGDIYKGEFKNGNPQGKGVMTFSSDDCDGRKESKGVWGDGLLEGHCRIEYRNGSVYEGEFQNDKAQGKGVLTFSSNDSQGRKKYEGSWRDGKRGGTGSMSYLKGGGNQLNSKNHSASGDGTMTYRNGDKYVGSWVNGKQEGYGTMTYGNGDKYVGGWWNGQREGEGTMTYRNGDKYVGSWVNGQQEGKGSIEHKGGGIEDCIWENGKMVKSSFTVSA